MNLLMEKPQPEVTAGSMCCSAICSAAMLSPFFLSWFQHNAGQTLLDGTSCSNVGLGYEVLLLLEAILFGWQLLLIPTLCFGDDVACVLSIFYFVLICFGLAMLGVSVWFCVEMLITRSETACLSEVKDLSGGFLWTMMSIAFWFFIISLPFFLCCTCFALCCSCIFGSAAMAAAEQFGPEAGQHLIPPQ